MSGDFDLELARRFDGIDIGVGWAVRDRFEHGVSDPLLVVGRCADGWFVQSMQPHPGERPRSFFAAARSLVLDYTDPGTRGHIIAALGAAHGMGLARVCANDGWGWTMHSADDIAALAAAWEGRPK